MRIERSSTKTDGLLAYEQNDSVAVAGLHGYGLLTTGYTKSTDERGGGARIFLVCRVVVSCIISNAAVIIIIITTTTIIVYEGETEQAIDCSKLSRGIVAIFYNLHRRHSIYPFFFFPLFTTIIILITCFSTCYLLFYISSSSNWGGGGGIGRGKRKWNMRLGGLPGKGSKGKTSYHVNFALTTCTASVRLSDVSHALLLSGHHVIRSRQ